MWRKSCTDCEECLTDYNCDWYAMKKEISGSTIGWNILDLIKHGTDA